MKLLGLILLKATRCIIYLCVGIETLQPSLFLGRSFYFFNIISSRRRLKNIFRIIKRVQLDKRENKHVILYCTTIKNIPLKKDNSHLPLYIYISIFLIQTNRKANDITLVLHIYI